MPSKTRARGRPKSFYKKAAQNTIQSVDRAINVLEVLASKGNLTLSDIAFDLDQSPATIYRVLSTLEARNIVEVDRAKQVWNVGPAAFQIGYSFLRRSSVVERSRPVMRELMDQTGETANLGIEKTDMVMFVSQVETHETIRAFFPPGTQSPMHASGIGKALLAYYSTERITQLFKNNSLEKFTDNTITDTEKLRKEIKKIRKLGFAFDDEEKNLGMRCIAAPILNFFGEAVAGISVSGPTHRMSLDRIEIISKIVKQAATTLSYNQGAPSDSAATIL
ncbi:MAG: HTH-type transcriptional regulator BhcR [Amylibacter sp.]